MIIGLTGQTGSGKSTLCQYLEENGFYICSCDEIAKEVRSDKETAFKIAEAFGHDLLLENGELDRKRLAARAFSSKESISKLNAIMHPAILSLAFERINNALKNGFEFAVLDAPQLFESGAEKGCDFIVSIIADRDERLRRILIRDEISEQEALSRISVQYDDGFYTEKSDYVIVNNEPGMLEKKAAEFVDFIRHYTLS